MSHHSALWFWAEHAARGRRPPSRCTRGLEDARVGSATLESLRNLGILRRGRPVDLLVASQGQRRNGSGVRCHCLSGELPRRSFSELAPNVYVCVPELCFLQLAGSHSPVDLLRLGMELCGHYSLAEGRRGFLDRPPLCSRAGLLAYLDAVHATRGVAKARCTAGLVIDGSASPMESSLALLLCLPTRWGGYGLPRPILNGQLTLSPGAARIGASCAAPPTFRGLRGGSPWNILAGSTTGSLGVTCRGSLASGATAGESSSWGLASLETRRLRPSSQGG